jgi:hypothetical protein
MSLSIESKAEQERRIVQAGLSQHLNAKLTLRESNLLADAILSAQATEHVVMWTGEHGKPMHTCRVVSS